MFLSADLGQCISPLLPLRLFLSLLLASEIVSDSAVFECNRSSSWSRGWMSFDLRSLSAALSAFMALLSLLERRRSSLASLASNSFLDVESPPKSVTMLFLGSLGSGAESLRMRSSAFHVPTKLCPLTKLLYSAPFPGPFSITCSASALLPNETPSVLPSLFSVVFNPFNVSSKALAQH